MAKRRLDTLLTERGLLSSRNRAAASVMSAEVHVCHGLGPVLACLAPAHDVLALVKPQFEIGRGKVGKGGVVRDAAERREALVRVGEAAVALGAVVRGYHSSGLPGPKGNRESFIWLAGEPGAADGRQNAGELAAMARGVEP